MRAVTLPTLDGPKALVVAEVPEPAGGPDRVVVDVRAAGIAYPDLLETQGRYQVRRPLPFVPGSEVAGVVRSAPAGSGFAPGDRVLTSPGGWQEVVSAAPGGVFPLPDGISFAAGAGILVNYLTCVFALRHRARAEAGETLLVHGAAGGVGLAGLQLGKALGLRTIAVASDERKRAFAASVGADVVVPVEDWLAAVREATGGRGVDIVLDPVGGDRFTDSVRSLAPEGRLLVLGFVGGDIPTVKVNRLLLKNVSVVGVGWGEYARRHPDAAREKWAELAPFLASGAIAPPEGVAYPFERVADALTDLGERRAVGKLVLVP